MTKEKKKQMKEQLHISNDRGATFVGFRPVVFKSKKHDKKKSRRDAKKICRNF